MTEIVFKPNGTRPVDLVDNVKLRTNPLGGGYEKLDIRAGRGLPDHPRQNIELMHDWINDCTHNHPQCQKKGDVLLPKRVIAVGTKEEPSVYLYESDNERAEDTIEERKKRIEWSYLSKTFQESIALTRLLGLRYLWIDSLCIIQDDTEDWQVESSKMESIYEGAYVTIAANNTSSGLLDGTELRAMHSVNMQTPSPNGHTVDLLLRSPIQHENFYAASLEGGMASEDDYPLLRRAWCYQERLLATRVLQFTDTEVVFECKAGQHCECGSINHAIGNPIKSFFGRLLAENFQPVGVAEDIWEAWTMILRPYITKDLTVSTDILPALAGVAARMQRHELGQYVAGLWEKELATGLFWFADILDTKQPSVKTAPTFSWAALAGTTKIKELTWPYMESHDDSKQTFKITDFKCSVSGLNPYGTVASASVELHGFTTMVKLKAGKRVRGRNGLLKSAAREEPVMVFMDTCPATTLDIDGTFTCFFGFTWSEDDFSTRPPGIRHCVSALLLRPSSEPNVYERVGCIPQLNNNPCWLDDAEERNVTII
ncbi:hypothetical protein OHC33_007448 [Knufia fluminis]|uniref:Heterokaryon incompatibility domain-containing protein n=1 Tax=Knufia fluminis TaxID=191047 RepID=A0AAN8I2J9_9EURO|nr:hypothetical protein OHC33_007448 [Knufia fluminis]